MKPLVLSLLVLHAAPAAAEPSWTEIARIEASAPGFGASLAVDGDTLAVASAEEGRVAVHVYLRSADTWEQQAELSLFGQDAGLEGVALDLERDRLAIGDAALGTVFVYRRREGVWSLEQTVMGGAPGSGFGQSVAVSSEWLAIGSQAASAALYQRRGGRWEFYAFFDLGEWPSAVALEGPLLVMTVPDATTTATNKLRAGVIAVYRLSEGAWGLETVLEAAMPVAGARLGAQVTAGVDRIAATTAPDDGLGGAFLFRFDGQAWQQAGTFDSIGGGPDAPVSADAEDEVAVLGSATAIGHEPLVSGAAFASRRSGDGDWERADPIPAPGGEASLRWGTAVRVLGSDVLVGAPRASGGAVHVFRLQEQMTDEEDEDQEEDKADGGALQPEGGAGEGSFYGCRVGQSNPAGLIALLLVAVICLRARYQRPRAS